MSRKKMGYYMWEKKRLLVVPFKVPPWDLCSCCEANNPSQNLQVSTVPIVALHYLSWVLPATCSISRLSIALSNQSIESLTIAHQPSSDPHYLLESGHSLPTWVLTSRSSCFVFPIPITSYKSQLLVVSRTVTLRHFSCVSDWSIFQYVSFSASCQKGPRKDFGKAIALLR